MLPFNEFIRDGNKVLAPVSGSPPERAPLGSNLGILGECKSILHVDSKVANRILDLAKAEQDLNGAKIAGGAVDYRCLRSAKRMRPILASHETDTCYPFVDGARVLAGAEMPTTINPAGKDIIVHRAAAPIQPSQKARPSIRQQFELNRPSRLLLHHDCPRSDLSAADNVADLHLHQVAAPKFAIDR